MHLRLAKLIAYHDLELSARRARRVSAHLSRCARCRHEYERVKDEVRVLSGVVPEVREASPALGLARLITAVAEMEAACAATADDMRQRVREQLQIYFGEGTVAAAEAGAEDGPALLRRAEGLFTTFLGADCAARLMDEILDHPQGEGAGVAAC